MGGCRAVQRPGCGRRRGWDGRNGVGTSGGLDGTSGEAVAARWHRYALAATAAVLLLIAVINTLTVQYNAADAGKRLYAFEPWLWEFSSATLWIALTPLIGRAALALRPPRLGWPAALAAHAALTVPVSAAHVGGMVAIRAAVYRVQGLAYDYGWSANHILYEYRKDVLTYATLCAVFILADRLAHGNAAAAAMAVPAAPPAPPTIEVRDGARTHWLRADEIDWAQAAGNYVELHTARGPVLHRATLASLEETLGPHGFARIHRSRLVRLAALATVESTPSGDFEAVLSSGARLAGSRRFRAALER